MIRVPVVPYVSRWRNAAKIASRVFRSAHAAVSPDAAVTMPPAGRAMRCPGVPPRIGPLAALRLSSSMADTPE